MPTKKETSKTDPTDFSDIVGKITPVHEVEDCTAMLVYGKSGTGKTAFASTFPKPLIVLDVQEKGTETISQVEGIDVISIESWDSFQQIYWYLASGKSKYKSVVIDQISQLQAVRMQSLRSENKMEPTDTFSRRDWGVVSGDLQTWLLNYRNLRDSGLHVCFIAHERSNASEEAIEDQIDPSIGPRVMPSVSSFINGAASVIGNTFIRETFDEKKNRSVQYCMRVGPHAYYVTKVRKPVHAEIDVPDVLVNPTFEKIMSISRGEKPAPKRSVSKRSA